MPRPGPGPVWAGAIVCLAAFLGVAAQAQGKGGGAHAGGMGGGHGMPSFGGSRFPEPRGMGATVRMPESPRSTPTSPQPARAGLQFGPAGQRWWDDHSYVKSLKLRPDQQARMDAIFEQNRGALVSRLESVQQAEAQMAALAASPAPDEDALFAQIDRVAQARAELEKMNTHLLLELRKEMDPEQIKKLQSKD